MRKLLFILIVLFISCSTEEETPEMCCDKDPEEMEDYKLFRKNRYEEFMKRPEASEEQRMLLTEEYNRFLENPCRGYIEELESAGASCENPY